VSRKWRGIPKVVRFKEPTFTQEVQCSLFLAIFQQSNSGIIFEKIPQKYYCILSVVSRGKSKQRILIKDGVVYGKTNFR
jgi:hypothetical protein